MSTPAAPPRRRILRRLGAHAMSVLLVVATVSGVIAVGGAAVMRLTGRQVAVVLSGSMTPQFVAGDAVIVRPAPKPDELRVGQIVTFRAPGEERMTTHRIVSIIHRPEGLFIQTKGDANATPDPNYTPASNVVGIAGTVIPGAGRFVILYTDRTWRLVTLGIPLLVLLAYHLTIAVRELRPKRHSDTGRPDDADQDDDDRPDGGIPIAPQPTAPALPSADLPPRTLAPARPHPVRTHPVGPRQGRQGTPPTMRRVMTLALSAVLAAGISVGTTGAVFSASAAAHTSFSANTSMCGSSAYDLAVAANRPTISWPHGSAAADASGTYSGSVTMPVDGAMYCSDATSFDGTGALTQSSSVRFGSTFTIETWFRSSATPAAQIVGFGDRTASQGNSSNRERVLYIDSAGRAAFAYDSGARALTSSTTIADGAWHYLAVTYRRNAATLYVDGRAVASVTGNQARNLGRDTGYWRAGTDTVAGLPGVSTSGGLTATLDDTAIYTRALTSAQIAAHWSAATN